jgi:hypothetical protein
MVIRAKKGVCPVCGKRGVGRPRPVWAGADLVYVSSCRYCGARGRRRVTPGQKGPIGPPDWS